MKKLADVAFSALPGYTRLFTDFLEHPDLTKSFFSWDFRNESDWHRLASLRAVPHRGALAEILVEQNRRFGGSEPTIAAANSIGENTTFVVTTGQQLAVGGGCLFYFLKTITVIKLARRLSTILGRPVVPVFWMEGEDHDLPEVDHLYLPGEELRLLRLGGIDPGRQPIGGRVLPASITGFLSEIEAALPATEFSAEVGARLRASYPEGTSWADAFGRLWAGLFPGLVLINPSDPEIKRLAQPVFAHEIAAAEDIRAAMPERDHAIEAAGYELQVRTGYPNFFRLRGGARESVTWREGRFFSGEPEEDVTESLELAEELSPKVLLRPVVQDFLLPNLATVAGPGETAYFAQAEALYEAHGVVPSILYPRAAATIFEKAAAKLATGSGITLEMLCEGPSSIFDRVKPEPPEEALFAVTAEALRAIDEQLRSIAAELDRSLVGAVETAREKMAYQLNSLHQKFGRTRYQREDVLTKRVEAACAQCFPLGNLQERVVAGVYFLAKYGPAFLSELEDVLEIDGRSHQVLVMDSSPCAGRI